MRIAFDGRVLERPITGIGRYLLNILEELPEHDARNEYFIISNKKQQHVNSNYYRYISLNKPIISRKIFTPLWLNYFIPQIIEKESLDIFIGSNILVPLKKSAKCKYIAIIHDIMPLTHPEFFPFSYRTFLKFYLPEVIQSAELIITISETSKKNICDYFNIPEEKVKVVYNTISKKIKYLSFFEREELKKNSNLNIPDEFLLYVGNIEKRKNIESIINIAKKLDEIDNKLKIVLVGRPGFGFENFKKSLSSLRDRIILFTKVTDDDLLILYNSAKIFIFPTYVEGFGLPPLEAMACGIPVIASNCDALKEVAKDAAILVYPDDVDGFLAAIKKLLSDKELYDLYSAKSLSRASEFGSTSMINSFMRIINSF